MQGAKRKPWRSERPWMALGLMLLAVFIAGCGVETTQQSTQPLATLARLDVDGQPAAAAWVAFRDGEGAWEAITARDAHRFYSHPVTDAGGRYAFAAVNSAESELKFYVGTLAETNLMPDGDPLATPPHAATVTGEVAGAASGQSWSGALGSRRLVAVAPGSSSYAAGVRFPGSVGLMAVRRAGTLGDAVDRLWILRSLMVTGDRTQGIDFEQATHGDSGEVVEAKLTDSGSSAYLTAGGGFYVAGDAVVNNGWVIKPAAPYLALRLLYRRPTAGYRQSTDAQCLWGDTGFERLTSCATPGEGLGLDWTGQKMFSAPTLTGGTVRWAAHPGAQSYEVQLTPGSGLKVRIQTTAAAAGLSPGFTVPDLTGVAGWKSQWQVAVPEGSTTVTGWAMGSNQTLAELLLVQATKQYRAGYRSWQAYSDPAQLLGKGSELSSACKICRFNCEFVSDQYYCNNECDLICGN